MNDLRQHLWQKIRNIRKVKLLLFSVSKPFFCRIELHKIRRGFGWSKDRRFDCCYKCRWTKWYKDPIGRKLLDIEISNKEKIKKLIKLANAIINPASEILPETYDNELSNYWDFITTLTQNKDE